MRDFLINYVIIDITFKKIGYEFMCGIVGYLGKKSAVDYLLDGLEILEYRGYDSAGIALLDKDTVSVARVVGRVEALRVEYANNSIESLLGIGHTRWATHGKPLERNAHPQNSQHNNFSVVHNGIIENYLEIKQFLKKKGYSFSSDTDTEVIPNLIDYHFTQSIDVEKAFLTAIKLLNGAYAVAMISTHAPGYIFAAKLSSPLAIGIGKNGEMFLGSDGLPMAGKADKIVFLEDNEAAIISSETYRIINLTDDSNIERAAETLEIEAEAASKGRYPDYMLKEIHEAPQTVRSAMLGRLRVEEGIIKLGGLEAVRNQLKFIERIIIIACGTSYYAGMVGEYLIEEIAGIPVEVQQASEFRYRSEPLTRSTAVLVISQSGETADAIAALKKLDGTGILRLGVVNAPGSTLARLTDAGVYCHAGPEKAVASTKAFIAQVTVLCLIALHLSKNYADFNKLIIALDELPVQLEQVLKLEKDIQKLAKKYATSRHFLFIGRRYLYPVALEGALKLKEISYIHAEGFAGGEMKHGPLALIDEDFPTFALALSSDIAEKSASNMQEIRSRGGPILAVIDDTASEAANLADDVITIPKTLEPLQPILAAVVTHLFAYYVARELDRDIDKPRNLAKSVTVE
ncbi:MAG: glutamine--fructose-6-phosphate transaminase (isomerizing) [bacterium]|nr:glutamine--fructose-6-phosphate transaminase (isomerizing) [bacterium]